MKKIVIVILIILHPILGVSQTKIGDRNAGITPSAELELSSMNKGLSLPNVKLLSTDDVTTVLNPVRGMKVFNINTSGIGVYKVFEKQVYIFNGIKWEMLIDKSALTNLGIPTLYGTARLTNSITLNNLNTKYVEYNVRDGVVNIDGSIQPLKAGYYRYSCKIEIVAENVTAYNPFFATPGSGISFLFTGPLTGRALTNQTISFSNVVYLNSNDLSGNVGFAYGGQNRGRVNDKILTSEIIWVYLGDI